MINFAPPSITQAEINEVVKVLKSGWLTTGQRNKNFSQAINRYLGSKYSVPLSSCTAALHLALICAGIKKDDEVITTPFTFVSTINTILYLKAKPVFVDIKENDFILDETQIEKKITRKTKAILPVHYAGFSADLAMLRKICQNYNLELIEDAAHAFGSKYKSEFVGSKSRYCCFSFYPTKNITTIEGGALVTNDRKVYERSSMLALHGISKGGWKRYTKKGAWRYDVAEIGYKYNMSDIQAILGTAQLKRIDELRARREQIFRIYKQGLAGLEDIEILAGNSYSTPFRHLFVIKIKSDKITRDRFIAELKQRDIVCSVHFIPVYKFSAYKKHLHIKRSDYPNTENTFAKCVSLPFSSSLEISEAKKVVKTIRSIFTGQA